MNILFVAPIQIHANASAGAETINLYINELSKYDNKIRVIARDEGRYFNSNISYYTLPKDYSEMSSFAETYRALGWILFPQNKYLYKTNFKQRSIIFRILKEMKATGYEPDVIMLETTSTILLVEEVKKIFNKAVCIASLHDFAFQGSQRKAKLEKNNIKKLIRNRYLKYAEQMEVQALSTVDVVAAHNAGNIEMLRKYDLLKKQKMFPLVPYYSSEYMHDDTTQSKDILFYGLMSRPENYMSAEWFIDNVMPYLPKEYRFVVMGGKPTSGLLAKNGGRIKITGFVSEEEVKDYFESSWCLVAPLLFGSGIKTKILSALSAGLPVITNEVGIEGIHAKSGEEYIHCELPENYVKAILKMGENRKCYVSICESSRSFMDKKYNKAACGKELNSLLKDIRQTMS